MKFWIKNILTNEIVAGFKIPRGYSARDAADNWFRQNNIKDIKNYKIIYKCPF